MIRVGIVDDQNLIRDGLSSILESSPDIRVVFRGADGQEFVEAVRSGVAMDVALVDIRMPRMDGLEATRLVTGLDPSPAVVVLTTFDDDEYVMEALQVGAVGFLLKRCSRGDLLAAVSAAAAGTPSCLRRHPYGHRPDAGRSPRQPACPPATAAADRTRDRGTTRDRFGAEQRRDRRRPLLSESTVKTHVSNVLAKTHSRDRVQAALLAVRTGLV